jgi:hypothetical protein
MLLESRLGRAVPSLCSKSPIPQGSALPASSDSRPLVARDFGQGGRGGFGVTFSPQSVGWDGSWRSGVRTRRPSLGRPSNRRPQTCSFVVSQEARHAPCPPPQHWRHTGGPVWITNGASAKRWAARRDSDADANPNGFQHMTQPARRDSELRVSSLHGGARGGPEIC